MRILYNMENNFDNEELAQTEVKLEEATKQLKLLHQRCSRLLVSNDNYPTIEIG